MGGESGIAGSIKPLPGTKKKKNKLFPFFKRAILYLGNSRPSLVRRHNLKKISNLTFMNV